MYWVAISSSTPQEREEKWTSIVNHIINVHIHEENKIFLKCCHDHLEREWIKSGNLFFHSKELHCAICMI